ncbi:MAG: glycosyltransferase family 39 protein, partial [Chloroflexota bacterium]
MNHPITPSLYHPITFIFAVCQKSSIDGRFQFAILRFWKRCALLQKLWRDFFGPSHTGWALLLALLTAVLTRFYQLGDAPPGLYRDEAFNGLDALAVLEGQHAIFFTANNGREPGYIYLTAVAISILGRTPLAVRISAAIVGSLTTLVIYGLGKSWFGRQTAVYAAWIWAITLWPIHLSRIGFRTILLPIILGLVFWIGTEAYRRKSIRLWALAGAVYGLAFYTYLAIRFT